MTLEIRGFSQFYGRLPNFLENRYVEADSGEYAPCYDPGMGKVIAEVPLSTRGLDGFVRSAREAYEKWSALPIFDRVQYLFRLKVLMQERVDELARVIAQNVGKTVREGRAEVLRGVEAVDAALGMPHLFMSVRKVMNLAGTVPEIDMECVREPVGVFAVITPFNFPVMIPMWFIPMAVTLGNTVILKPSEQTPVPTTMFVDLFREAGYPPGVVNLVHGGPSVSRELITHPEVSGVTFVGSSAVGERIYSLASEHGKRALCQCGAKNPVLLMPDAVPEPSIENIVGGFFDMCGQRCLAPGLLITVGDAYDRFVDGIVKRAEGMRVGYQLLETTEMGAMVSSRAKERVAEMVERAIEQGARPLLDGRGYRVEDYPGGFYLRPTILTDVSMDMDIAREEVFGPVMPVVRASSFDEALELANSGSYGNTGTIYTSSGRYAREFARRMMAGNIAVNMAVAQPQQYFPFPGRKRSFFGVLHGQMDAVDFFTDRKVIMQRWW
ncbi:aldehyde dehydrogenase family protein [Candidatus Bathyarchaeota archaeon]|nr:aldehyde dehydrogenase family protein [Candidatus Bathyarchaeota archaeon]